MSFVTSRELLLDAQARHYAVGAFNVENMEFVQAVIAAAEEAQAPVILQTTPGTLKYAKPWMFAAMVKAAAEHASVPVVMHLDHGDSFDTAMRCFRAGYSSIMIDGSKQPFEENVRLTRSVVEACHSAGIPVEAELGKVGGKEDDLVNADDSPYTDPAQAREFVERTGVDSLAIAIGTAHGVYKVPPVLDVERIDAVKRLVSIPFVLHGTSGVPDDKVRDCIRRGMCKVNYATDLRIAYTQGVKDYIVKDPEVFDPKKYGAAGLANVKQYVLGRMEVVGCIGKA
ncbi:MAG: class II fructose-bisphosphate aldolase [Firmicutes bacterium]|nr:class II fructose-bisphosphate aldolase [Bacillota bacterium]